MHSDHRAAYRRATAMGERVWTLVETWTAFERDALGRPLVRAVDAVGALVGAAREPAGRARRAAAARGALREAEAWLAKAYRRGLIPPVAYAALQQDAVDLARLLRRRGPPLAFLRPPPAPPAARPRRPP